MQRIKEIVLFIITIFIMGCAIWLRVYLSTNGYIDVIDYINKNQINNQKAN